MSARYQTLSVVVQNKAGVLARVASLFARRGFNIVSLAVAPTDGDDTFSRITIVIDVEQTSVEQITKQLFKLVNVVKITELEPDATERELLLATVAASPDQRSGVIELIGLFGGRIVDVGAGHLTVMVADEPSRLDDVAELLRPYGVTDMQRTGRVALPRLERQGTVRLRNITGKAS